MIRNALCIMHVFKYMGGMSAGRLIDSSENPREITEPRIPGDREKLQRQMHTLRKLCFQFLSH